MNFSLHKESFTGEARTKEVKPTKKYKTAFENGDINVMNISITINKTLKQFPNTNATGHLAIKFY